MTELVKVRREYTQGPFGQVHLYIAGKKESPKPPMVCFHQSPLSGRTFEAIMKELGRDRFMVAPDTPGYGQSDAPAEHLTIEQYAKAQSAVIDAMNFDEIDVIGTVSASHKLSLNLSHSDFKILFLHECMPIM